MTVNAIETGERQLFVGGEWVDAGQGRTFEDRDPILSLRAITAPIAFGNTVVLKPSEWSPISGGLLWGEVLADAGFPPGVLNVMTHAPGEAGPIGDELVEHPAVRRLNFTGSTATGRKLAEAAGRNLGPLRRPRGDGRVHRAPLGHGAERHTAVPVLDSGAVALHDRVRVRAGRQRAVGEAAVPG